VTNWTLIVLVVGVCIAAYADLRSRRIPNLLTGTLAAAAIVLSIPGGWMSVAMAVLVMLAAFVLGTLAFSFGWFGGGDVKLLAACCGFAGFPHALDLVLYTFMAGGIVTIIEAAGKKRLRTVLFGTYHATLGLPQASVLSVPYGLAIAIGACTYALSSLTPLHFLRLPL
jgi:prepilin peptidase CpaA